MSTSPLPPIDTALLTLAQHLVATGYHFVTGTPATHARVNARPGNETATSLAGVFGWSRPFLPSLLPPALLDLMHQSGILEEQDGQLRSRVRLSTLHGMSVLHSAYPTTAAEAVFFGPDTYRFADAIALALQQPATIHRAVDIALALQQPATIHRAVDIGCGAGPGALVVAKACPQAEVHMVDINPEALRLARINAALNGTPNAHAAPSNLLTALPGTFDLIVANPPYMVDPAERAYRHGGGPLGAGLSLAILDAALTRLNPGGRLLLYTGAAVVNGDDPFHSAAAEQLTGQSVDWSYREIDPDVFGEELDCPAYRHADRIAAVCLTVTKKE